VHKLTPVNVHHRLAQKRVRGEILGLCTDSKAYQRDPAQRWPRRSQRASTPSPRSATPHHHQLNPHATAQ